MHKKLIVLFMALFLVSLTAAMAAENGPGCGVGQILWEGQDGLLPHSSAGTTNATFSNSFAITSGTSGCDVDKVVLREKEQEHFVAANLDIISEDLAQGRGAHLNALATLMGCSVAAKPAFARMTRENFQLLFDSEQTDTLRFLDNLKRQMLLSPVLSSQCSRIS